MYRVIKFFTDLQDHDHAYRVGDEFPRRGLTVSEERFAELAGTDNKRGIPLIEKVGEQEPEAAEIEAEIPEVIKQEEEPEEKVAENIEEEEEPKAEKPKRKPKK